MTRAQSVADVLRVISDEKTLGLFRAIGNGDGASIRSKRKLTRKQYYSRLLRMKRSELVKRNNGKYVLTAFGKVVYNNQITIQDAINNYWNLVAIDSILEDLPKEEHKKVIETLLENGEIKEILMKSLY